MKHLYIFVLTFMFFASMAISADKKSEDEIIKIGDELPKFILKDADDNEYSLEKIIGKEKKELKLLVLVIGDQTTRKNGNAWAKEFDKLYKDKKEIEILMIADLRGLPFFVTESMVKWGTKRENLPVPILLDWKGKISEKYKTKKGESNIFVVDKEGKIRHYLFGEYSPKKLKELQSKLKEGIEQKEIEKEALSK